MLTIRPEQLQVFSDYLLDDFCSRVAGVLGAEFPETHGRMPLARRKEYVRTANEVARSINITSGQDVEELILIASRLGIDLSSNPVPWGAANDALKDPNLTAGIKLKRLAEKLPAQVRGGSYKL
jgi:hypothetical protein